MAYFYKNRNLAASPTFNLAISAQWTECLRCYYMATDGTFHQKHLPHFEIRCQIAVDLIKRREFIRYVSSLVELQRVIYLTILVLMEFTTPTFLSHHDCAMPTRNLIINLSLICAVNAMFAHIVKGVVCFDKYHDKM